MLLRGAFVDVLDIVPLIDMEIVSLTCGLPPSLDYLVGYELLGIDRYE